MAKKSDSKSSTSKANNSNKHIQSIIWGLLLVSFALFLLISFLSYCFTWQSDQSLLQLPNAGSIDVTAQNFGGKFGHWLSAKFIGSYYGLGALGIPCIIALFGTRFLKYNPFPFVKTLLSIGLGSILLSIVLSYISILAGVGQTFLGSGPGGTHGYYISKWLLSTLGGAGSFLSVLFLIIIYLIFISVKTVYALKQFCAKLIHYFVKLMKGIYAFIVSHKHVLEKPFKEIPEDEGNSPDNNQQGTESTLVNTDEVTTPDNGKKDNIPLLDSPVLNVNDNAGEEHAALSANDDFLVIRPEEDDNEDGSLSEAEKQRIGIDGTNQALPDDTLPDELIDGEELYDPTKDLSGYQRPPIDLLEEYKSGDAKVSAAELEKNKDKIVSTLNNYKIGIEKIIATIGPTVTLYEIVPKAGIRISSIRRLEDDIALSLAALGIRIIAPIPGKGTVGIEVPNERPDIVSMHSIIKSAKFQEAKFDLPVALGKTISNETYVFDLAKMPHLLVAGATGQGKSVGLNAILTSLLYKKHPAELKIVMVDPKKVELTPYAKIERHFLAKMPDTDEAIITDTQKVVYTLKSLCIEMDSRYDLLKMAGVRNVKEYNEKFVNRRLNPNKGHRYLPYIVVVIDEFADLIMTAGREIEEPIARLAQLARAIGIHLVIATQRPTTNIITGLIKANFPARIAFRVTSMVDSRTILDSPGANQLIGRGDMLVSTGSDLIRVQCGFVDTPEVDRVTDFIGKQPGYLDAYELPEYRGEDGDGGALKVDLKQRDEMFEEAARMIVQYQQGSTSLIQRKMSLGYNRAGRIMDQLEAAGVVGPSEGSKARQVLISDFITLDNLLESLRNM